MFDRAKAGGFAVSYQETFDSAPPRGVDRLRDERFIHRQQPVRRSLDAVLLADAGEAGRSELAHAGAIAPQRVEPVRERRGIVRRDEQAAAGPLDDLREG